MDYKEGEANIPNKAIIIKEMIEVEIFPNLSQGVILTTEDRLKLHLQKNLKKSEKKQGWLTPFSLLFTIATVFVTSDFKDYILPSNTWEAIFIIIGITSFIWLAFSIKHAFSKIDIEDIIEDLKTNSSPKK